MILNYTYVCIILYLMFYFFFVLRVVVKRLDFLTMIPPTFLKKELIKKKNVLNLVYLGFKCNWRHPHLYRDAIYSLLCFTITISSVAIAIVAHTVDEPNLNSTLEVVAIILFWTESAIFFIWFIAYVLKITIHSKKTKRMLLKDKEVVKQAIKQEYPDFFDGCPFKY